MAPREYFVFEQTVASPLGMYTSVILATIKTYRGVRFDYSSFDHGVLPTDVSTKVITHIYNVEHESPVLVSRRICELRHCF